eukprot:XP_014788257.1 PREDICTED: uncharacterized protein LOC106882184 [Octopus bimaculoides]
MKEAAVLFQIATLMACLYVNASTFIVNNNDTNSKSSNNNNIDDDVDNNTKKGTSESSVVSSKICNLNSSLCGSGETCVIYDTIFQCRTLTAREQYFCKTCDNGLCDFEKDGYMSCYCKRHWTGEYCTERCLRNCTTGKCILQGDKEYCECPDNFTPTLNCTKRHTDSSPSGTIFITENRRGYSTSSSRIARHLHPFPDTIQGKSFATVISTAVAVTGMLLILLGMYLVWKRRFRFSMKFAYYFQPYADKG